MEILIILIPLLAILLYRPLDHFIKGDDNLFFDYFSHIRKLLLIITLALLVLEIFAIIMFISNPSSQNKNAALAMGASLLIPAVTLFWMRKLYRNYYTEDRTSFTRKGLFKDTVVPFNEIKEVYYYRGSRGGSGLKIKDHLGKKVTLPHGYFNYRLLKE